MATKKTTINSILNVTKRMPKSLNEALNFNEEFEEEPMGDVSLDDEPEADVEPIKAEPSEEPQVNGNASDKARQLIDDIRKMSLRAMAELADTPEDENYIMLKKVWSMTDRKPEQKSGEQI